MIITLPLLVLYPIAIQYKRGGVWKSLLPLYVLAGLYDVFANYTEWSFLFGLPKKKDYTVSKRIKSMIESPDVPSRTEFAKGIQAYLDFFEPDGKH